MNKVTYPLIIYYPVCFYPLGSGSYRFTADFASPHLLFPQIAYGVLTIEMLQEVSRVPFVKISFPLHVIRVGFTHYQHVVCFGNIAYAFQGKEHFLSVLLA